MRVSSPEAPLLSVALRQDGAQVSLELDDALRVEGMAAEQVGDIACAERVRVHELTRVVASLEAVYLALTGGDVEYRAGVA